MRETVTTTGMHIITTNLENASQIRHHLAELYAIACSLACYICDIPCVYEALYLSYLFKVRYCLLSGARRSR